MSTKIKLNGEWIDVANNSVSDSVRNPDWSKAVTITNTQLVSNTYRFPEDGLYINSSMTKSTTSWCAVHINGIVVSVVRTAEDINVCVPVNSGDLLTSGWSKDSDKIFQENRQWFVPYKIAIAEPVYIGEKINGTKLTPTITTLTDTTTKIGEITLTKGKWLIYVSSWTPIALESTEWAMVIFGGLTVNIVPGLDAMIPLEAFVSVNSTTTYDLNLRTMLASPKTIAHDYVFYAVRIG